MPGPALAWLLPLSVYGGLFVTLFALRRALPAKYRTGELRTIEAKRPEPSASTPITLSLAGTDGTRAIRLRVDDEGIHWAADKRLLVPAAELRVRWSELESVHLASVSGPAASLGWFLLFVGLLLTWSAPTPATFIGALGLAFIAFGFARRRGTFTFVTASHTLTFQSRELQAGARDQLLAAVRSRVPRAAPSPEASSPLRALFAAPFIHLVRAMKPSAALREECVRSGEIEVAVIQLRMFSLWIGVMSGAGPLSLAIGAMVWSELIGVGLVAFFVAWLMGLLVVGQSTRVFARFSGMSVVD